jgi:hypothetical protein
MARGNQKYSLPTTYYLLPTGRGGFTLIELLLFAAIFVALSIGLVAILVSFTRVQVRQGAVAEVSQQSQFLSQTIQRYIEEASWVDLPVDTASTSLKLRTASSAIDPAYIYLENGVVYLRETDGGTPRALTSGKVTVSQLTFTKRSNAPGKDYVSFRYTVSYNSTNPQQQFAQSLQSAIARVNAATFDSDLVPPIGVTNLNVGVSGQKWQTINGIINFSGSNVGINVSGPTRELEVNGGLRLNTTAGIPSCGAANRGTLWFTQGDTATDTIQACIRNSDGSTYAWNTLGGGSSASSSLSGSGAANSVAKWTGTNVLGTSVITDDGTNIGIGDSSPLALLTVGSGDLFRVTSAGLALLPAGAVGAPSLSFTADTNTGIWSSTGDVLNFSTGGSERLTISGANVGVASSSPGALFAVGNSFRVDASGNVASGVWQGTAVGATKGGTGQTTVVAGNLLYGSAADTWSRLAIGSPGDCLKVVSGVPGWQSCGGSGGAPTDASYVVIAATSTLSSERVLTAGTGISLTDGGANGNATIAIGTLDGARVNNSSSFTITNNTDTALTFNSERYDTNNLHSTVSNTSRLTAQRAGKYLIIGHASYDAPTNGGPYQLFIRLNGTTKIAAQSVDVPIADCGNGCQGQLAQLTVSAIYSLALNDYVELVTKQVSGSSQTLNVTGNYSPEFEMQWLGP